MSCCGEDEYVVDEFASKSRSMSFTPFNDLRSTLSEIKAVLGTDDIEILASHQVPSAYMVRPKFRDRAIARYGLDTMEPIASCALHDWDWDSPAYGFILYECRKDPDVKYVYFSTLYASNYSWAAYILPKGKVYRFMRLAKRSTKEAGEKSPPLLEGNMLQEIIDNTVGFLSHKKEIEKYNVKIKRGVLLRGQPGNGKTMACRWIERICNEHGVRHGTITAQEIKHTFDEGQPLDNLFSKWPVTFFDDIDIGFLNRKKDGKIACSILSAMDGMKQGDHTIRIFTTNESIKDLDEAFVRPGRIDRSFTFNLPSLELRRRLITERWSPEIRDYLVNSKQLNYLLEESQRFSFADLEGIKSLLVTNKIISTGKWDLNKALRDFYCGRRDLKKEKEIVGFSSDEHQS